MRSLISLNYFDQKGVVKTSGYKRYSFRYNLDHKITKWWDYGISATFTFAVLNITTKYKCIFEK